MKYIPKEILRKICNDVDGDCSLYVSLPEIGEKFTVNEKQQYKAASTIKIPLLALLLSDFETGRLDRSAIVPITKECQVGGSGILRFLSPDTSMSLFDFATLMIILSDNSATNKVIDAVGLKRGNEFIKSSGWDSTHLGRKMYIQPKNPDEYNLTSAEDLGNMMERILSKTMVNETVSTQMMQILATQQRGIFASALPVKRSFDPTAKIPEAKDGKVVMADKGGSLMGKVLHDAAIIFFPSGIKAVLVMMTATPDNKKTEEVLKKVAKALFDSVMNENKV